MECCKCTCENPTCSCLPQEVTAFKDNNGNLHKTKRDAMVSDIKDCVNVKINKGFTSPYNSVSTWDIEKVLNALSELDLLKID